MGKSVYSPFWETIEVEYGSAKISAGTIDTILRKFEEWKDGLGKEDSSKDLLWEALKIARDYGYELDSNFVTWLDGRLESLRGLEARDFDLEARNMYVVGLVGAEYPVAKDVIFYMQPHQKAHVAKEIARYHKAGSNDRVFFHAHQPGMPCEPLCEELVPE